MSKDLKINNSLEAAIKSGDWKNPGAKLYEDILDSYHFDEPIPTNKEELDDAIQEKKCFTYEEFLKETYLVAPVKDLKNPPYKHTPFSRSGCKYPHHVIRDGELVVSIPGLKAAYKRAAQAGIIKGSVKSHLKRHVKELGLEESFSKLFDNKPIKESTDEIIERNFGYIYDVIQEHTGISLSEPDELYTESTAVDNGDSLKSKVIEEIGQTPESIFKWMNKNISYDKTVSGWRLKTPWEVYTRKKGNCHDQSLFESTIFDLLNITNGQLFFMEFSKGDPVGGNTHTLTWYKTASKGKKSASQYYWFENAWEDQAGIHGPYKNINEIKNAILETYKKDKDINSHKYDGIVFGESSKYYCGMSLGEYVESWKLEDDRYFKEDALLQAINEHMKWIDEHADPDIANERKSRKWNRYEVYKETQREERANKAKNLMAYYDESSTPEGELKDSDPIKWCDTPDDLLKWMSNNIQYGWRDKSGNINGTGENDDETHFYKEYRLQSPQQLIKSGVGVCWDCTELSRLWFTTHGYSFAVIYIELSDGDGDPSHTFLIYKKPGEDTKVSWFDALWNNQIIHEYKDLETCLKDIVEKFKESQNTKGSLMIRLLKSPMKKGMTCKEYMAAAHNGTEIDLHDLSYNNIFSESNNIPDKPYTMETLPDIMYFGSRHSHDEIIGDKIFLTPYQGIASIFVIDHTKALADYFNDVNGRLPKRVSYNGSYAEWHLSGDKLSKPLKKVHIFHNIPEITDTITGTSDGFIHCIDISDIRDELKTFVTNDPDREVYYEGGKPLKVSKVIPCSVEWEMKYSKENQDRRGRGIIESMENYDDDWMMKILMESPEEEEKPKMKKSPPKETEYESRHFKVLRSNLDDDFKSKGYKKLSDFTRVHITTALTKKFENQGKLIKWMRDQNPKYDDICYLWTDKNGDYVGAITYHSKPDKNGYIWISGIDVAYKYQGYGIGKQLLEEAIKGGVDALSVQYDNEIAIKMYKDRGFQISEVSRKAVKDGKSKTYDMFLNTDVSESSIFTEADEEPVQSEALPPEEPKQEKPKKESLPKQTDRAESDKNGVRRKKLYIAFIEWCKTFNSKNTFGSLFDKDVFHVAYPFVPEEMRYFYRLANPMLCVLSGNLTFFAVAELRKLNAQNSKLNEMMIFAATDNDLRVFNRKDKKVYLATHENGAIKLGDVLGNTFDIYLQKMINQGDILNGPIENE